MSGTLKKATRLVRNPTKPPVRESIRRPSHIYWPSTFFELNAELPPSRYRIWLRAVDANGNLGDWSQPSDFSTDNIPVVDAITTPPDVGEKITFTWPKLDDADHYNVWTEYVEPGTVPDPIRATLPKDKNSYDFPEFTWAPLPGAATYEIRIDDTVNQITGRITKSNITSTNFRSPESLSVGTYAFQVRGISKDGTVSHWSTAITPQVNQVAQLQTVQTGVTPATTNLCWRCEIRMSQRLRTTLRHLWESGSSESGCAPSAVPENSASGVLPQIFRSSDDSYSCGLPGA